MVILGLESSPLNGSPSRNSPWGFRVEYKPDVWGPRLVHVAFMTRNFGGHHTTASPGTKVGPSSTVEGPRVPYGKEARTRTRGVSGIHKWIFTYLNEIQPPNRFRVYVSICLLTAKNATHQALPTSLFCFLS